MMAAALVILAGVPLVALPVLTFASPPLVWMAGLTGTLCVVAAFVRSIPLAAAASIVAALTYTLALWLAQAPHDVAGAIVFGIALVVLLEGTAMARRFHGAAVLPSALRRQVQHWLGLAAAAVVLVIVAAVLAELAVFGGPGVLHAAVAALGAVAAVLGVVGVLRGEAREIPDWRQSSGRVEAEPPA